MPFLQIRHKQSECIGCALCTEIAPAYWSLIENGEAQLQNITRKVGPFNYAEGFPADRDMLKSAESGCPVNIIQVH